MLNYKDTLEFARKNKIDVFTLDIAYELDANLIVEIKNEDFERLCLVINKMYLKSDNISISDIAYYIASQINEDKGNIEKIINMDIYELLMKL